jgi:hypothetical protein
LIRDEKALPRLIELSGSVDLDTSLAAERSLEDFTGPKANQALAGCLLGWQDGAWERAGNALVKRDKQLLIKVLLQGKVPPICRYYQGILLARCNHPSAVPILCDEVRKYAMIDIEMFTHIARLGNPEHADLIRALPINVRTDQGGMAEEALIEFMRRMKAGK